MSIEVDYKDEKTWNLFKDGYTKGIFQLESQLGRSWSKRLEPTNIEELSALISIIRPGTLKAMSEGKSMTQHYVDRKHGKDEVSYIDNALESILGPTYGVLVYQEQAMRIAQKLAGFDLQEADDLRKAIGKKKADLMAKIRVKFMEGCRKVGMVSEESAKEIFGWIEKSARYSFNKSHAVSYAINAYESAWYKANYTKEFFLSYLFYASEKQDTHEEVYELISEAKLFDIEIKLPNLSIFDKKFNIDGKYIYFGIKDIKSLTGVTGDKVIEAIKEAEEESGKSVKQFTWMDVLVYISNKINSTAFKSLCSIGFFSIKSTGVSRNKALYEYLIYKELTKSEMKWVTTNYKKKHWKTVSQCFKELHPTKKNGGGCHNMNRSQIVEGEIELLINPPYDLADDPSWIIEQEIKFLGCPISLSKVESSDTSLGNTSCKDILNGKTGKDISVAANINRLNNHTIKKGKSEGKTMSFLSIEDESCSIDNVIVFPEARDKYQFILYEGNNLLFHGKVDNKDNSFIIDKIHEI